MGKTNREPTSPKERQALRDRYPSDFTPLREYGLAEALVITSLIVEMIAVLIYNKG